MNEMTQNAINNMQQNIHNFMMDIYNVGVCDGFGKVIELIESENITDIEVLKNTLHITIENFNKPDPNQFSFVNDHYEYQEYYIPTMTEILAHPNKRFIIRSKEGNEYDIPMSITLNKYLDIDISKLTKPFLDEIENEIVQLSKSFIDNMIGTNNYVEDVPEDQSVSEETPVTETVTDEVTEAVPEADNADLNNDEINIEVIDEEAAPSEE